MNAPANSLDLAPALVVLPGPRAAVADVQGGQTIRAPDARELIQRGPVLVAHASMTARRLGLNAPPRMPGLFDALELYAFAPREREGEPRMMLAEAGTGVGKTLGYLAPASLWAEANGPSVWVSTYTRALQRQIERESHSIYPDPKVRAKKAVVRKGRENYLCLLNFQDMANTAQQGGADLIGMALTARWARATRDGDMTGGDFPAWLPTLFAVPAAGQASAANLVDRRGECVHAGCQHYRACFVEKAIRGSRKADLVIANHALVLTQAAFDGARAARGSKGDGETTQLKRIVFDEGHHLFDHRHQERHDRPDRVDLAVGRRDPPRPALAG